MTTEMQKLRETRNKMLEDSDWTVMPDSPFSDSKQADWKTYRQSLRDLTKTAKPKVINTGPAMLLDMSSVTFPTKPS
tara:strand:+ start:505 stop:735 length:231 start_codon:yes stop_codon:yes gene_type:complete